jgi:hypothetical protein
VGITSCQTKLSTFNEQKATLDETRQELAGTLKTQQKEVKKKREVLNEV